MDFLFLDVTHDTVQGNQQHGEWQISDFGKFFCGLFDEWTKDNNSDTLYRYNLAFFIKRFFYLFSPWPTTYTY